MTSSIGISSTWLSPFFHPLCEIFEPDKWPGHRPENILFRTKDPSSDIVIADFGMYIALTCSQDTPCHMRVSQPSSAKHLESAGEQLVSLTGSLGYVPPVLLSQKGAASRPTSGL